ncbi:hypothetical protein MMC25_002549 [Agyrium rufum]|nr:hypothetical protein [Agyrium rufum]
MANPTPTPAPNPTTTKEVQPDPHPLPHQGQEHLLALLPFPETPMMARLRSENPSLKVTYIDQQLHPLQAWTTDQALDPSIYASVTMMITLRMLPLPEQAPNLRYVHIFSAGTEHMAHHALYQKPDVIVTSSSGSHGPQIAEWVLMHLLSHFRRLRLMWTWQEERRYGVMEEHFTTAEALAGKRMGILGYGSIGRHIASLASAFKMDVIAYTASPKDTPESRRDRAYVPPGGGDAEGLIPSKWYSGTSKAELHEFLRQDLDILILSVPLTAGSRHLIGDEEFSILAENRHAYIVNVARGAVVDQKAMIRYLKGISPTSFLCGAALDVTDPEPLPADNELWTLPNVTVTPHISAATSGYIAPARRETAKRS